MTHLVRILCCAAAIYFGVARNIGPLTRDHDANQPQSRPLSVPDNELPRQKPLELPALDTGLPDLELYRGIMDRNAFGLKPMPSGGPDQIAVLPSQPRKDLILTGLVEVDAARVAFFTVSDPNGKAFHFSLHEGQGNAWLDVRSVDVKKGAVRVLLKQPVVRIQNAGTEVILSFKAHGQKE